MFSKIIILDKNKNLLKNSTFKTKITIKKDKKVIGKIGWNPFNPELNLIKFKKSIPKLSL